MDVAISINKTLIQGVSLTPLTIIEDDRGAVLHMLRADVAHFQGFGEVYFSETKPGVVKGWKQHKKMTQNFSVPAGRVKLIIYDDRPDSATRGVIGEYRLGRNAEAYQLLTVPPGLWYGFQCLGDTPALIANCSDMPHDPNESIQVPLSSDEVPYDWC